MSDLFEKLKDVKIELPVVGEINISDKIAENLAEKRIKELEKLSSIKLSSEYKDGFTQGFIECTWNNRKEIQQLKQQLEEANKSFNSLHKIMDRGQEENYKLKQQLEEANKHLSYICRKLDESIPIEKRDSFSIMVNSVLHQKIRQFLAKYRGGNK